MKRLFHLLFLFLSILVVAPVARAQSVSYSDVMVIVNDRSSQSTTIAGYFASRRNIPSWHVCHINVDSSESIDSASFVGVKRSIEQWMRSRNLSDSINYIVTTKGCPLRVTTVIQDDPVNGPYGGQASFEECIALMNGSDSIYILTPKYSRLQSRYYGLGSHFDHDSASMPFYLVTRLDGFTVAQVQALIRAAESPANPSEGIFVFDMDPSRDGGSYQVANDYMRNAGAILRARGLNVLLDSTTTYIRSRTNVLGYVSWGSNDNYSGGGSNTIPLNSWLNGSIAETYVSTSGRSFTPGIQYGQSLIADLVADGVAGVKGYTDEPYLSSMAHVDILFDRYTNGFNMAESFYAASRWAAWRQVVIGDPKMRLATPVIQTPSTPTTFCEGDSVVLRAPAGYARQQWSTGDTAASIVVRQTGNYSVTMTGTYGYTATSPTVHVQVNPKPRPVITANGPTAICSGDSVTLDAGSGFASYRWSRGDTTRTIVVRSAGAHTVTVTNASGCSNRSDTLRVTLYPKPSPKIATIGATQICRGDSVTLDGGAGYLSYRWSTGDTTRKIVVRESGSYSLGVVNANGCSGRSDTVRVQVHPLPSPAFDGPTSVCLNSKAIYLAPQRPHTIYRWGLLGGGAILSGSNTNSIEVAWGSSGSGSVTLRVSNDSTGCSADTTITVSVGSALVPAVSANRPTRICQGDSVTLSADAGYASYRWSTGEVSQSITVADSGHYTVTVADAYGCSGTSEPVVVTINTPPAPSITPGGKTDLCEGESITLDAGGGYSSYRWSNGETTRTIVVSRPGSYSVSVIDSSGCSGSSQPVAVRLLASPGPKIDGPDAVCLNSRAIYIADSLYAGYEWKVGGGTILSGQGTGSVEVEWGSSGSGTVDLQVTSPAGCTGDATSYRVAIGSTIHPAITPSGSLALCEGASITLAAPSGYDSYQWSNGSTTQKITVTQAGSYWVNVASSGGCRGTSDTATIAVRPAPMPDISPRGTISICEGDSVRLEAPPGYAAYSWSSGEMERTVIIRKSGRYHVTVIDSNGCSGRSEDAVVIVNAPPAQPVISVHGDTLSTSSAAGYQWYLNGSVVPGATAQNLIAMADGLYSVRLIDGNGCSSLSAEHPFRRGPVEPLIATATIRLPEMQAAPGDTVKIPLMLGPSSRLDSARLHAFTAKIRLDGRILLPADAASTGTLYEEQRVVTISGVRVEGFSEGALAWLEFVAADAEGIDSTALLVESFVWNDGEGKVERIDGSFRLLRTPKDDPHLPGLELTLGPHRPNPVRGRVEIDYALIEEGRTKLYLTDIEGRIVTVLVEENQKPGAHTVEFDATNVESGLYFYVLETPTARLVRPMHVMK
jgi:uncharacterized protein (TIGR03790 family)